MLSALCQAGLFVGRTRRPHAVLQARVVSGSAHPQRPAHQRPGELKHLTPSTLVPPPARPTACKSGVNPPQRL